MMKRNSALCLFAAVLLVAVTVTGCNPAPSGKSIPEDFVEVKGNIITGSASCDSQVFIAKRSVDLNTFYICNHEVTLDEYKSVMGTYPVNFSTGIQPARGEKYGKRAAPNVSWYEAIVYCNKLSVSKKLDPCYSIKDSSGTYTTAVSAWVDQNGSNAGKVPSVNDSNWNAVKCDFEANGFRLPTEAEWEYAARGARLESTTLYAGSNTLDEVAWHAGNADGHFHQVALKQPNSLGLYDMSGNMEEWCWDWYGAISSSTEATGPTSGSGRLLRGGGWRSDDAKYMQVKNRDLYEPEKFYMSVGFRVCMSE